MFKLTFLFSLNLILSMAFEEKTKFEEDLWLGNNFGFKNRMKKVGGSKKVTFIEGLRSKLGEGVLPNWGDLKRGPQLKAVHILVIAFYDHLIDFPSSAYGFNVNFEQDLLLLFFLLL